LGRDEERPLVERLWAGEELAFAEVVRTYQNRIFNIVFRMLSNRQEAEDVAQEVFVSFYTSIHRFRGDCSISSWLYKIAINQCRNRIKYLRLRRVTRDDSFNERSLRGIAHDDVIGAPDFQAQVPRPDDLAEGLQMERFIQEALTSLEEDQRTLIVLRDIEGLTYQDMVEVLDEPLGTIKSRLHRARMALKDKLARLLK